MIFLADVHLGASPAADARFARFLQDLPPHVTLVSLGDLVDIWAEGKTYDFSSIYPVLTELRSRVNIHIPGNRDFLMGSRWRALTGGRILPDGAVFRVGQFTLICLHGDTLLTSDYRYQLWRRVARSSVFRTLAGLLGRGYVERTATAMRSGSRAEIARKREVDMRIDREEAARLMEQTGASAMICGHVHSFERSPLGKGEIMVLGSWDRGGEVVVADTARLRLLPAEEAVGLLKRG